MRAIILVDVRLDGPPDRALNSEMLVDLLWAHARPDHCITHISATASKGRADLVLFVTLADEERLRAFVAAALTRSTGTQDWRVRS